MNRFLSKTTSLQLLNNLSNSSFSRVYDSERHRLIISDSLNNEVAHFRLPIVHASPLKGRNNEEQQVNYVILLIQSGNCAVGYFENGVNLDHKVFRSYMVRKKQGKSQVKYLKTKGKSRAGSRVRLGETVEFFENINKRLNEYFEDYKVDRIAMSCSKILIPYLFNSKVPTPFDKRDERILKIPKHVHTPIYDVMLDVNKFLLKGELIYDEANQKVVDELMIENDIEEDNE